MTPSQKYCTAASAGDRSRAYGTWPGRWCSSEGRAPGQSNVASLGARARPDAGSNAIARAKGYSPEARDDNAPPPPPAAAAGGLPYQRGIIRLRYTMGLEAPARARAWLLLEVIGISERRCRAILRGAFIFYFFLLGWVRSGEDRLMSRGKIGRMWTMIELCNLSW